MSAHFRLTLIGIGLVVDLAIGLAATRDHGPKHDPTRGSVTCMYPFARLLGDAEAFDVWNYRIFKVTKRENLASFSSTKERPSPALHSLSFLRRELSTSGKPLVSRRYYQPHEINRWKDEINSHLDFVFKTYLEQGVVLEQEVLEFKTIESGLEPLRTEYFVFVDRESQKTNTVIQIYYGGPTAGLYSDQQPLPSKKESWKIPIEREYPNLVLEERKKDGSEAHIINLARLAGSGKLTSVIEAQFGRVAERLFDLHAKPGYRPFDSKVEYPKNPVIYIETPEIRAAGWVEKGFTINKTSSELKGLGGPGGRVLLRMPVSKFVKRWYPRYEIKFPRKKD